MKIFLNCTFNYFTGKNFHDQKDTILRLWSDE